MKKLVLPVLAAMAFSAGLNGQQIVRCSSYDHLQQQLAAHPEEQQHVDQVEQAADAFSQAHPSGYQSRSILIVPVVFHIVYNTNAQNISSTRILEQIQVLNQDYRKQNTDASQVPAVWQSLAADCEIEFCLAKHDPNGNWTDGIDRVQTTKTSFSANDSVKYVSSGGAAAWDPNKYLNIWVCNLTGGLLGYSTFPSVGPAVEDGVVLGFKYVGKSGATAPYNLGRTATHEVGHYFSLRHIWGDESGCAGTDAVSDTPNQGPENYGTPTFPHTDNCQTAAPGVMFMNYMDYVDDNAMFFFTAGQKTRMWSAINNNRMGLLTSDGCIPTSVSEINAGNLFAVHPSPTSGAFTLEFGLQNPENFDVNIYNVVGEIVYTRHYEAMYEPELHLDLAGNAPGLYFVEVRTAKMRVTKKLLLNQ